MQLNVFFVFPKISSDYSALDLKLRRQTLAGSGFFMIQNVSQNNNL